MIYKLEVPGPIEDVEETRVLEWHAEVGKIFAAGEMIVELETHKAVVEVRAGQSGVLREILCPVGTWQKIGEPLALLSDDPDEPLPASAQMPSTLHVTFEIT